MNELLKGALNKKEFTSKFYYIYKEAYKYDPETLKIFNKLLKYPNTGSEV